MQPGDDKPWWWQAPLGNPALAYYCLDAAPPTSHRRLNHVLPKNLWVIEEMREEILKKKKKTWGLPGGSVVKNLPANAEDMDSTPDLGRYPMRHGATKPVHHNC